MSALARAVSMLRPKSAAQAIGPIGIDFSIECVHLVQLEMIAGAAPTVRARASLAFESSRRETLAEPQQFRELLKKALSSDNFYGRKAVCAVPSGMFRTVSINYQANADQDDANIILRVMRDRLDGDLSDYVLDYLPVKSRSKNNERLALVAVSEREPIVMLLESARKASLDIDALEIGPVAISRLVGAISSNSDRKNVLVINSGRRASYLTLISGEDLLFDQQVSFGEHELVQQLAETLDMPQTMARDLVMRTGLQAEGDSVSRAIDESGVTNTIAEILKPHFLKLAEEIKRVFLYAAAETRGGAVSQVYLLGSIARWPGSDVLLASMMDVIVAKIPDPLSPFASASSKLKTRSMEAAPEIAVATGLALRGLHQHG